MSAITGVNVDVGVAVLYAELQERKEDLALAGLFGKSLLEEKEGLKNDLNILRKDYSSLEEMLEFQKQDSLGALHEVKVAAKVAAAVDITQLEVELENSQLSLEHERTVSLASQQEMQRSLKQMDRENCQLKEELTQVVRNHKDILKQLKNKLELSEEEKRTIIFESTKTRNYLEELEEEKLRLARCLSSAQRSCEQLTSELNSSRQEAHFWESQYLTREHLLCSRDNELGDTKDRLEQLEQEMNLKDRRRVHHHVPPGISLFDELSGVVLQQSHCGPACASSSSMSLPIFSCDVNHMAVDDMNNIQDSKAQPCHRCKELEALTNKQKLELDSVDKQLLIAVEQKFKLQEQIEAWQSDMMEMVESKVNLKLSHHFRESNKYRAKSNLKGVLRTDSNSKDCHRGFAFQALKKSWIF